MLLNQPDRPQAKRPSPTPFVASRSQRDHLVIIIIIIIIMKMTTVFMITNGQSGDMEFANSGRVSPHGLNMEGRKWNGFSSESNEEEEGVAVLSFNEEEGFNKEGATFLFFKEVVFGILEEREGVVGVLSKEEVMVEDFVFVVMARVVWGLLLVEELRLMSAGSCLLLALLDVNGSLVSLILLLSVPMLSVVVVTGGCIVLTDASRWADMGQLCSVYGACTA